MGEQIELTLSGTTFNELIEALEKLCEQSDNYDEIKNYFCIIQNLNSQKREYYAKLNESLREEFRLK